MRKILIATFLLSSFFTVNAQDSEIDVNINEVEVDDDVLTSKRGERILPEAGDIGFGLSANPFLNFIGNMFNGNEDNSIGTGFYGTNDGVININNIIYGKYFLDSETAVRVGFRIGVNRNYTEYAVNQDGTNDPNVIVTDAVTRQASTYALIAGLEKRRGNGRLQGIYGAEVLVDYSPGSRGSIDYANPITDANRTPSIGTMTGTGSYTNNNVYRPAEAYRTTEYNMGTQWGLGLRGFLGVEYFILPKVSLGAEVNWGPTFSRTGDASETFEYFNPNTNSVETFTIETDDPEDAGRSRDFSLDTGLGGGINILFYF